MAFLELIYVCGYNFNTGLSNGNFFGGVLSEKNRNIWSVVDTMCKEMSGSLVQKVKVLWPMIDRHTHTTHSMEIIQE